VRRETGGVRQIESGKQSESEEIQSEKEKESRRRTNLFKDSLIKQEINPNKQLHNSQK
jgi:hypothetical protein